ncbi:hypothetical protein PUMCH_000847 [Australozyma saopauloensis]|uniref:Uncharacterized protein n=1 Tax=Australozyma saopauloensis TaxID=291208 RepID=A0AAX4H4V3_9ASCO|nr:hypothetical protein PUMCH_000847 [[Candida] saopauloensis]
MHPDRPLLIKSTTPFISALKHIDRSLEKLDPLLRRITNPARPSYNEFKDYKYVLVKGMGKCIPKTISIALYYRTKRGYRVDISTGTDQVLDTVETGEVIETREGPEKQMKHQKRDASYVVAKIWFK